MHLLLQSRYSLRVQHGTFSLPALFAALDGQRQARGLTWTQAMREINAPFEGSTSRPISLSTVTSTRTKPVGEGDGILQMLRWLGRSPESFVVPREASSGPETDAAAWPDLAPRQILRFDTRRLHAALNAKRVERGLTWQQVAEEIGGRVTTSTLTGFSKGGRTGFPHVMRIVGWLERPAAEYTRATSR